MVERRGELRLPQKPGAKVLVARELRRDHLQRNFAREALVRREKHRSHAAAREHGFDRVAAERLVDVGAHRSRHVRSR